MPSGNNQIKNRGGHKWVKGQSGNPKGRPKKDNTLISLLKDELDKIPPLKDKETGRKNTKTWAKLLAEALPPAAYKGLLSGNVKPYAILLERIEGKVKDVIDLNAKVQDTKPPVVVFEMPEGVMLENYTGNGNGDGNGHKEIPTNQS